MKRSGHPFLLVRKERRSDEGSTVRLAKLAFKREGRVSADSLQPREVRCKKNLWSLGTPPSGLGLGVRAPFVRAAQLAAPLTPRLRSWCHHIVGIPRLRSPERDRWRSRGTDRRHVRGQAEMTQDSLDHTRVFDAAKAKDRIECVGC